MTWQAPALQDQEFKLFQKLLYDTTGIALNDGKKPLVSGRLMSRLRHFELRTFDDYFRLVKRDAVECQMMTDLLTTNETRFFREPAHFVFMREKLLAMKGSRGVIRAWSAACSSGEEPYTMAMTCAETLGIDGGFDILGSDISQRVLDRAERGVYSMERAEGLAPDLLKKYCLRGVRSNEGTFCISRELRRHVKFRQINLLSPPNDLGHFDFIFLRNVMIYFDAVTRKQIVDRMMHVLKPGGFFVIGTAESLISVTDQLETAAPHVYRRRS
ncbi:MAG: protein-glutamate O-methyltransferase CheR [Spirochaetia bacterium]|nr:protein-glutamate O-methyltransferase CheR [Spirochaetia bacterium]